MGGGGDCEVDGGGIGGGITDIMEVVVCVFVGVGVVEDGGGELDCF